MYQYLWDAKTGGLLLTTSQLKFSKEPRPVYASELTILGFDQYWSYPKDDHAPLMWAEANNYIYRGRMVAKTKGGSYYTKPKIVLLESPEPDGMPLQFVDIEAMTKKNEGVLETLSQETIQTVYNTYRKYRNKIDVYYVAFSGGKDSVVALDIVQRALPHDDFLVLFGDTRMEFPDTYQLVEQIEDYCMNEGIRFYKAVSKLLPAETWSCFGPPSTSNRWCCSVHKTSPQINLLREITGKQDFTGMAFTGVRADESLARSSYEIVSEGRKHSGQMSCHAILNWSSAEIYCYIYARHLHLNEAYKKGNMRVGCLVCPNSTGKHEYIKRCSYKPEVDFFLGKIISTSGKIGYSESDMRDFIDGGFWRTRKSGRELNFGQDKFEVIAGSKPPTIDAFASHLKWKHWGKTIGDITQVAEDEYVIQYEGKSYIVKTLQGNGKTTFVLENCEQTRADIKFQSLMKSIIVKSLYCVGCGVCEAECKHGCINMKQGIAIGDNCAHCYKCHDVKEHCLRYASIRNKIKGDGIMTGIDRYYTFGMRAEWLESFIRHNGGKDFWLSDGDGLVANKKKEAFRNFANDAGLTAYDKTAEGDRYTKCLPTPFAETIIKEGSRSQVSWALMLCNLVYTPAFNWFVTALEFGTSYTPDLLNLMLTEVMRNDTKGKGKRNVIDSLKIMMAKTPLGKDRIFANCDINEITSTSSREKLKLNTLRRCSWDTPDARVILYSLYRFAEMCGGCYQFTLSTLLDDSIEREGVSPTRIFGLSKDMMIPILNGLSVNYPDFISASFSLGLDTINLHEDKSSQDVLAIF